MKAWTSYSATFKAEAVARIQGGEKLSAVAMDLNVAEANLYRWVYAARYPRIDTRTYPVGIREEALSAVLSGEAPRTVSTRMKVKLPAVYRWLKEAGYRPHNVIRWEKSA